MKLDDTKNLKRIDCPGFGETLSEETKKSLKTLEDLERRSMAAARNIFVGRAA